MNTGNKVEKKVLLIVDDRPENLDLLISFLEKCDFNIIVAKSGEETFKRLDYSKPDIIILDIMMPGIDGFETCRRLKKDDRYREIPVIFMSALDDTVDKVKGLELGAVDYISKPFMHEEVLARINNHLQIQDLRKKLEIANRTLEKRVVERTVELEETNQKLREEITERKQIEHDLKLFKELINRSNDALFVTNAETGRFIDVNNRACSNLGYTREELLTKTVFDIEEILPDKQAWNNFQQKTSTEVNIIVDGGHKRKDGSVIPVEVSIKNIELNGVNYNVAVARDITERKIAEEKLRESERGLKEAERIARLGHWSLDLIGNTLYWSDEVYRIFEIDLNDFDETYEGFLGFVHPDDRDLVNNAYNKSLQEKTPYEISHRILLKDEKIKYVHERGISHYDDNGNAIRSIGTVHDITERKLHELERERYQFELERTVEERTQELGEANEKLKEIDQLKSMFIASMSHELRTPLNSIIGFTCMTLEGLSGALNEEQHDNINRVHKSAKHLLALISDIIDISKIEAGAVEIYCEPFLLNEISDEAVVNIQHLLKGKDISIEVNVPEGVTLNTDRKRLLQCFVNLLSNAAKYTDSGRIIVSSKIVGENIELSVEDTGIGISKEGQLKLFTAFERLKTRLTVKEGGTGLGLYLTKKIATDLLEGVVEVESRVGVGSTFTLRAPMILNVKRNG